jgi:hypothetical protein
MRTDKIYLLLRLKKRYGRLFPFLKRRKSTLSILKESLIEPQPFRVCKSRTKSLYCGNYH